MSLLTFLGSVMVGKLIVLPFLQSYTLQDFVRFSFGSFRVSFQIIMFVLAAFLTVAIFSSATELRRPWSDVEIGLNLTYK